MYGVADCTSNRIAGRPRILRSSTILNKAADSARQIPLHSQGFKRPHESHDAGCLRIAEGVDPHKPGAMPSLVDIQVDKASLSTESARQPSHQVAPDPGMIVELLKEIECLRAGDCHDFVFVEARIAQGLVGH